MNKFIKCSFLIGILLVNFDLLHASNQNNQNDVNIGSLLLGYAAQLSIFVISSSLAKIGMIYFEKQLHKCGLQTTPDMQEIKVHNSFSFEEQPFYKKPARNKDQNKKNERYITEDGCIVKKLEYDREPKNHDTYFMRLMGYSQCKKSRKLGGAINEGAAKWPKPTQFKLDPIIEVSYEATMEYQSIATLGLCPGFIEESKYKFSQKCKDIEKNPSSSDKHTKLKLQLDECLKSELKALVAVGCTFTAGVATLLATTGLITHYYYKNK